MRALLVTCQSPEAGGSKINAATILKFKGSGAITTTTNRSLLDIAKLLAQHRIGCIVKTNSAALYRSTIAYGRSAKAARRSLTNRYPSSCNARRVTVRKTDTYDWLMSEMTTHRFRHWPVVERGRMIGIVSIGDLVKVHVADVEFESDAMRQYITEANPAF